MAMTGGTKGVTSEINVTPLIDVVLVLLIIFMVITPMLQKGIAVQLPQGADPGKKPDSEDDIYLSIKFEGPGRHSLFLQEESFAAEAIEQKLNELYERAPGTPVFIKADKRLPYGAVKEAMLICDRARFRDVALIAEAPQQ